MSSQKLYYTKARQHKAIATNMCTSVYAYIMVLSAVYTNKLGYRLSTISRQLSIQFCEYLWKYGI